MNFKYRVLILIVLLSFVVSACGGSGSPDAMNKPEDTTMEKPADESFESQDTPLPDAMPETSDSAMPDETMAETPAWFSVAMTDVNTGASFTINDLKGKVILVETMAVWCSNCFRQQTQVKALHETLGDRDDFVSIGMDIDPNEDASKLQSFISSNSFDWMYVVAPADVSRDLASLYGGQFLNPPSTPMLIIDRHGIAHPLPFGIKSADDLLQAIQPHLDEAM
ncbi:MAG TPA: hypothetical protein DCX53_00135 [Anaerolineae bacterium]|nr:hypothetical protein [Anaerolineae bacterium]